MSGHVAFNMGPVPICTDPQKATKGYMKDVPAKLLGVAANS